MARSFLLVELSGFRLRLKQNYYRFKYLLYLYVLAIVCDLLLLAFHPWIEIWADARYGTGFATSFTASLTEDLIFFGLLGILGLILSTKLLIDEEYSVRVSSLVNNAKAGNKAVDYIDHKIRDILNYSPLTKVKMTLVAYEPSTRIMQVHMDVDVHIRNMCKDIPVRKKPIQGVLLTDVRSTDGTYGYINRHKVTDAKDPGHAISAVGTKPLKIVKETTPLELEYELKPGADMIWEFSYGINWDLSKDPADPRNWFFHRIYRFTEKLEFKVFNEVAEKIDLRVELKHPKRAAFDQLGKEEHAFSVPAATPLHTLEIGSLVEGDLIELFVTQLEAGAAR